MFQDLGSSPSSVNAGKLLDYFACAKGNAGQQADAEQAYIQAELRGTETWVALPEEAWPPEWKNRYQCPVVRWKKALYGHPVSGGFWGTIATKS